MLMNTSEFADDFSADRLLKEGTASPCASLQVDPS